MSATLPVTTRSSHHQGTQENGHAVHTTSTPRVTARVASGPAARPHLQLAGTASRPVSRPVTARIATPVGAGTDAVAVDAAAVRAGRSELLGEAGASTAEYATVTGCGVGFAALLFKFLTSDMGQELLRLIFTAIKSLLPF